MKKILFIAALCFATAARAEQDALSTAIRETNIEKVEQLVKTVPVSHLAYYCSLADQIITLRREQRTNAEFLYPIKVNTCADFKVPDRYAYELLGSFGALGYGFFLMCWGEMIKDRAFKTLPIDQDLYLMSQEKSGQGAIVMSVATLIIANIVLRLNYLSLKHVQQNYEDSLNIKEILAKKQMLWDAQSIN